jgi:hypothetical protein
MVLLPSVLKAPKTLSSMERSRLKTYWLCIILLPFHKSRAELVLHQKSASGRTCEPSSLLTMRVRTRLFSDTSVAVLFCRYLILTGSEIFMAAKFVFIALFISPYGY